MLQSPSDRVKEGLLLKSKNLVAILGTTKNELTGIKYLVMESLALGTLRDLLRATALDTGTKLDIVTCIAAAIRSLHSAKPPFVHAAIRAKHVLLDEKLTAKVNCIL
jgi:serine/threonine protein kinase